MCDVHACHRTILHVVLQFGHAKEFCSRSDVLVYCHSLWWLRSTSHSNALYSSQPCSQTQFWADMEEQVLKQSPWG